MLLRKLAKGLATLLIIGVLFAVLTIWLVNRQVRPYIAFNVDEVEPAPVAIILGAQIYPNGTPSRALAHRLEAGLDLYEHGKVGQLILSGDGRSRYYDEVGAMEKYLLEAGVAADDLVLDREGLRTYSSCYRLTTSLDVKEAVVISQLDHVERAVFTCRGLGVDAKGLAAAEFFSDDLKNPNYWQYYLREKAALLLAWFEVTVMRPAS